MDNHKLLIKTAIHKTWHLANVERIASFWSPMYINHSMPPGKQTGMDNLTLSHQVFFSAFSGLRLEVLDQVEEHDKVASRVKLSGTHGRIYGTAG